MPESVSGVDEILRGLRGRQLHPRPGQIEPRVYLADAEAAVLAAASPDERLREALAEWLRENELHDDTGNPLDEGYKLAWREIAALVAADREAPKENHARLMEAAVRRATDAVCDFDPDAAAYRMRTEAWVRLALTVALRPPSASLSGQDETTKGRDDG